MGDAVREVKLPVRAGGDGVLVEEGVQRAARGKTLVLGEEFLHELGDPAVGVVTSGVGDEEVKLVGVFPHEKMGLI